MRHLAEISDHVWADYKGSPVAQNVLFFSVVAEQGVLALFVEPEHFCTAAGVKNLMLHAYPSQFNWSSANRAMTIKTKKPCQKRIPAKTGLFRADGTAFRKPFRIQPCRKVKKIKIQNQQVNHVSIVRLMPKTPLRSSACVRLPIVPRSFPAGTGLTESFLEPTNSTRLDAACIRFRPQVRTGSAGNGSNHF